VIVLCTFSIFMGNFYLFTLLQIIMAYRNLFPAESWYNLWLMDY